MHQVMPIDSLRFFLRKCNMKLVDLCLAQFGPDQYVAKAMQEVGVGPFLSAGNASHLPQFWRKNIQI